MAVGQAEWEELMGRLGSLPIAGVDLDAALSVVDGAVAKGQVDGLMDADNLEEWLEVLNGLQDRAQRQGEKATLLLAVRALLQAAIRLLPEPRRPEVSELVGRAWMQLGYAWYSLSSPVNARQCYSSASKAFLDAGRLKDIAVCLMNEAVCLDGLGRPSEALPLYQKARPILQEHGTMADYGNCLMNEANCLLHLGRPSEALPIYLQARPIIQEHGTMASYGNCLMNEAVCLDGLGRPSEALPLYQKALDIFTTLGSEADDTLWRLHYNLAALHFDSDRSIVRFHLEEAIGVIERMAGRATRIEDRVSLRESFADVYRLAVRLELGEGNTEAAFG